MSMQLTAQQKKALATGMHLAVTANAGSGKTAVLTQRYLDIAVTRVQSLREIAAITFTDKAASELYIKIARALDERLTDERDTGRRRKLKQLRRQLLSANISTIHSFCISLLRQFPVEAGIDASFTPIDGRGASDMLDELISRFVKEKLESADAADVKNLIRITGSAENFAAALKAVANKRRLLLHNSAMLAGEPEAVAARMLERALQLLEQHLFTGAEAMLAAARLINDAAAGEKPTELTNAINTLLQKAAGAGTLERLTLFGELKQQLLTASKDTVKKRGYLKSHEGLEEAIGTVEDFMHSYKSLFGTVNEAALHTLAAAAKGFYRLATEAVARFEQEKIKAGVLDFEDILIFAARLMQHESVREGIASTLKYIMIDEYQDTNELQYEIFLPVLDNLKRGNLFVVGDEKQSIYMFRQAELEIFTRTKEDIAGSSGEAALVTLPESFRMSPAVCAFANTLFAGLFTKPDLVFNEVGHSPLICARPSGPAGSVEAIIAGEEESEAELTARRMLQLQQQDGGGMQWKDFAILCRRRSMFAEYSAALRKYGIPFSVVGGTGFYQRQLVYDVMNYLAFLANQENGAALFGTLRSPFFTFSDAEIFAINQNPGFSLYSKLRADTSEKARQAAAVLADALAYAAGATPVELLRRITVGSPFLAVYAARAEGAQEAANFEKLIRQAMQFTAKGLQGVFEFVAYLTASTADVNDEGQAAVAEDSNTVKLMTIHQSKGLEYGTVILAGCQSMPRIDSVNKRSIEVTKELGILIPVPEGGSYTGDYEKPLPVRVHNLVNKRKQIAEIKRLLYVGVTRAKDRLLLSMTRGKKGFSEGSFAQLIGSVFPLSGDFLFNGTQTLTYLLQGNGNYTYEERQLHLSVPIVTALPQEAAGVQEAIAAPAQETPAPRIATEPVAGRQHGELISATRFAVYLQCPLKYYLKYHLRYEELLYLPSFGLADTLMLDDNGEERPPADELHHLLREPLPGEAASVKGRAIHKLFEENNNTGTAERARELVLSETDFAWNDAAVDSLVNDITEAYTRAASARQVKELLAAPDYRTEFSAFARQGDYYLHGILDRVIFNGSHAVIVDYKTDAITEREAGQRFLAYQPQLRFYAFLLSRLYPALTSYTLQLVFVQLPELTYTLHLTREALMETEKEINRFIESMRSDNFTRNTSHCNTCVFAKNKNHCVFPE